MIWKQWMVLFCLLFVSFSSLSQQHHLQLIGEDKDRFLAISNIPLSYSSVSDCALALKQAQLETQRKGFLGVSIDSLSVNDSLTRAWVTLGNLYRWANLRNGNIQDVLLSNIQIKPELMFNQVVNMKTLGSFFERMIVQLENNGYPFASLQLDSLSEEEEGKISAKLCLDKGPLVTLDSVILNEDASISQSFLLHYLSLKEGMLYNEEKIKAISLKIRELPFIQEASPWRISFNVSKTKLNLDLKPKGANRADVLIGLLPSNNELQGKFLLTGDVKLAFINALNQGESIQLNWQNLQPQSPRYNINAQYPYVFNTAIGITAKFDFYKKDSSFKNVNGELGLVYQMNAGDFIKLYYELASTRLGTVNTALLKSSKQLPSIADVSYKTIGFEWVNQALDYRLNPRKGYSLSLNAGVSIRNFIRNTTVEETFDVSSNRYFSYLYDSLPKRTNKYHIKGHVHYYLKLSKRLVLANKYNGAYTFSNHNLFRNELFQIGGYRLLRGFDEGSLFLNSYHVVTVEPRFILSTNSYFFLFTDWARTTATFYRSKTLQYPYSFGAGMTFETKGGLFNLSYAVGATTHSDIQLRNSKIHFGYVSVF